MKLFPEKDVTIETDRTPLEVLHILQNNTARRPSIFAAAIDKPFWGKPGYPTFCIYHNSRAQMRSLVSPSPKIEGTILPCSVTVHMSTTVAVRIYVLAITVIAVFLLVFSIVRRDLTGVLCSLPFLAFALLSNYPVFAVSAKRAEKALREILE